MKHPVSHLSKDDKNIIHRKTQKTLLTFKSKMLQHLKTCVHFCQQTTVGEQIIKS